MHSRSARLWKETNSLFDDPKLHEVAELKILDLSKTESDSEGIQTRENSICADYRDMRYCPGQMGNDGTLSVVAKRGQGKSRRCLYVRDKKSPGSESAARFLR